MKKLIYLTIALAAIYASHAIACTVAQPDIHANTNQKKSYVPAKNPDGTPIEK